MESGSAANQPISIYEYDYEQLLTNHRPNYVSGVQMAANFPNEFELGSPCGSNNLPLMNQEIQNFPHQMFTSASVGEQILDPAAHQNVLIPPLMNNNGMGIQSPPFINQFQSYHSPMMTSLLTNDFNHQFHQLNSQPYDGLPFGPTRSYYNNLINQFQRAPNAFEPTQRFGSMFDPSRPLRFEDYPQVAPTLFVDNLRLEDYPIISETIAVANNSRQEEAYESQGFADMSNQIPPLNSETNQRGILGKRRFEVEELSSAASSKRQNFEAATYQPIDSSTQGSSNYSRVEVRNALYDPLFEGVGLPIDPHLRMLSLK